MSRRTGEIFISTLERLIRESPDPLAPWWLIYEIQMDVRLLPTLWFSEVTDNHVAKLIYFDVVRLSTDHRAFLDDPRAINFLRDGRICLRSIGNGVHCVPTWNRFEATLPPIALRCWSFDQCAICCWILSQHQSLSTTGEDMVDIIRSQNIERELLEACERLFPFLPWIFLCSFSLYMLVA